MGMPEEQDIDFIVKWNQDAGSDELVTATDQTTLDSVICSSLSA
jgi:hypothetical protein